MEDYYDIDAILAEDQVLQDNGYSFGIQPQVDRLSTGR